MNSKQRRQDDRRWKWRVHPVWGDDLSYDEQIEFYHQMWDWCKDNFGTDVARCGWRDRDAGRRWEFDSNKKATLFILRWGG